MLDDTCGFGASLLTYTVGLVVHLRRPLLVGSDPFVDLGTKTLRLCAGFGMELGRLTTEPLTLDGQCSAYLRDFAVGGGAQLRGVAFGHRPQRVGLLSCREAQLFGLAVGVADDLVGLLACLHLPAFDIADRLGADALDLGPLLAQEVVGLLGDRRSTLGTPLLTLLAEAFGLEVGVGDDVGGLLLRRNEHLAGALAESRVRPRRRAGEALLELGHLLLELRGALLRGL